ncbi:MAG: VOC family protein [Chloroflexota bacterium]
MKLTNRPAWADLATSDPAAARDFYTKLFGWNIEVSEDPQYGGYATAKVGDQQVGGIGPKQMAEQPTVWSLYIGTDDVVALDKAVVAAGGTVISPAFAVGEQGSMAVYQDPIGAYVSAWQEGTMRSFLMNEAGALDWPELQGRAVEKAVPFYQQIFGWTDASSPMGPGMPDYHMLSLDDKHVAGALEMSSQAPAEMPSYWLLYFKVDDVDAAFAKAIANGAREISAPLDGFGQRFAVVMDPQGAIFGLVTPKGA